MIADKITRAKNSILGALVADAATMGFHWLYSQQRLKELAPEQPEFRNPTASDFDGNVGYFAHGMKRAGEFSHYGEQAKIMLDSMVANNNHYERHHYQEAFKNQFGYGGAFVGYIDRPTRETLDKIYRTESDAIELANKIPFNNESKNKQALLIKVLAAAKRYQGQSLNEQVNALAQIQPNPEESLTYCTALVNSLGAVSDYPGANDEQLPAISKLPALIARHADDDNLLELCDSAIRVTNNTPRALDFGMVSIHLMTAMLNGMSAPNAIDGAVCAASSDTQKVLNSALSTNGTIQEVTKTFGLHCDLGSGMASLLVNLKNTTSYSEAIRNNIYAAGDNCGRSIILGAACGAMFGIGGEKGIPEAWIEKVHNHEAICDQIDQLFSE